MNTNAQQQTAKGRIVVGVDGSAASIDALRWSGRQASLTGADLEVVFAWQYPSASGGYVLTVEDDWQPNAAAIIDKAVDSAQLDVPPASRRAIEGHPARVLVDAAAGAELLVVGSRGHGGFIGMLLGSVSEQVCAHAPCPVLVVRHAERNNAQ